MLLTNSITNQTVCSLNTYASSVRDFFKSKTEAGMAQFQPLIDGVLDFDFGTLPYQFTDEHQVTDVIDNFVASLNIDESAMIVYDGSYWAQTDLLKYILIEGYWSIVRHNGPTIVDIKYDFFESTEFRQWVSVYGTTPINRVGHDIRDAILSYIQSMFESAEVMQKYFDLLASTGDVDSLYGASLAVFPATASASASQTAALCSSLLKDRTISIPGKITLLLSAAGLDSASHDGILYNEVNLSEFTGVNPATVWVADAWDATISATVQAVKIVCAAIYSLTSILSSAITTAYNKVSNWLHNIVDGGVYYSKHYNLDPYIDTGALSFISPVTSVGISAAHMTFAIPEADIIKANAFIADHGLMKIPTPFATIYVYPTSIWSSSTPSPTFRIFFHPISEQDYISLSPEGNNTLEELFSSWSSFNGYSELPNDSVSGSNHEFWSSIIRGRELFHKWCIAINKSHNNSQATISDFSGNIGALGKYNDDIYDNVHLLNQTYKMFKSDYSLRDWDSIGSPFQAYAIANISNDVPGLKTILQALYNYICDLADDIYRPYVLCTNITAGSYSILSDSQAMDQFNKAMKILGVVVIAITVTAIACKVKSNFRLKHERAEVDYWNAINSGDALAAKKAARRSAWYNKLAGAASSSAASGNIIGGLQQQNATLDSISKLITG